MSTISSMLSTSSTSGTAMSGALKSNIKLSGNTGSFLTDQQMSPVQRMMQAQQKQESKTSNYFESETYLRIKSLQLSALLKTYSTLGLADQYAAVEEEATQIITKYQEIMEAKMGALSALGQSVSEEA